MIEVFCTTCGQGESDHSVRREEHPSDVRDGIDEMESESVETHFYCDSCGKHEVIDQGTLAVKKTQHFDLRERAGANRLTVKIDSNPIEFTNIDEQISASTHYTTAGARSTSRVHVIHIHAVNPPTVSKGSHEIEVGDHLNEEMILSDINYKDSKHRTLKFKRNLSDGLSEGTNDSVGEAVL